MSSRTTPRHTTRTTPPERTQKAIQARIRIGIDRRISELLAVAPHWTDEQRERIATVLGDGTK